ncbi:hypothetical protein Cgig2_001026 [Carnegiea gigantea]|uniref:Uncharacterized protein n=1 Tax=Carnegiea gigantea TaxID=171969 RepID=A0A9Q1GUK8_9CARY|nr:hypothetical protein Cgig2_001026 [Carnegiea gigantea]
MEVVAMIAGGYAKGITPSTWKDQLRSTKQVLTTEQGPREVNPTGMTRLPMRFGNKLRSKNLKGGGLHIGLSTVLMPLLLRSPDLSIQGVGGLIPCVLTLGGRRDKCHLFRVTTLIGGPLTLIHVVELRPSPVPFLAGPATPFFDFTSVQISPQLFPMPLVPSDKPLQSPAFCRSLHSPSKYLDHGHFLLGYLRELGGGVCLDEVSGWPLGDWRGTAGGLLLNGEGAIPRRPASRSMRGQPFGSRFPHLRWNGDRGLIRMALSSLPFPDR